MKKLTGIVAFILIVAGGLTVSIPAATGDTSRVSSATQAESSAPKSTLQLSEKPESATMPMMNGDTTQAGLTMAKGLGLCIAVLMIGVWVMKRFGLAGTTPKQGHMKVLERLAVTPKNSLILVDVEGRKVLVGIGPDQFSFAPQAPIVQEEDFARTLEGACDGAYQLSA